jgi:hypothetical protein
MLIHAPQLTSSSQPFDRIAVALRAAAHASSLGFMIAPLQPTLGRGQ